MTFSDETIQEIVGIFETNAIEIRLHQSECNGLYEIGSMMEHSCCPNVRMSFDDKFNVSLYTIDAEGSLQIMLLMPNLGRAY